MSRPSRPVERHSHGVLFAVLALLAAGTTVWAVWDEAWTRRPWKRWQEEFARLDESRAAEALRAAEAARRAPPVATREARLREELARLERDAQQASGAHAEAVRRRQELDRRLFDARQDLAFSKSEADQQYYEWRHAAHTGGEAGAVRERRARYDETRRRIEAIRERIGALEAELEEVWGPFAAREARLAGVRVRLARLDGDVALARQHLEAAGRRSPELLQHVNDDLRVVDRCPSCHVAADRPGWEGGGGPRLFRTHPARDRLLGRHPPERFGCTTCHAGQGTATQELHAHGHGGPLGLDPELHPLAFHVHFWDRPLLLAEQEVSVWDAGGRPTRTVTVPFVQSSCRGCHLEDRDLPLAPALSRARKLVETYGCFGCHTIPGYERGRFRKVGPSHLGLAGKVRRGWVARWIADPQAFRPSTRMPSFWPDAADGTPAAQAVRAEEAAALAALSWSRGDRIRPGVSGLDPAASAEQGERLVRSLGCLACHAITDEGDAKVARHRAEGFPEPPGPGQPWPADVPAIPSDHGPTLVGIGPKMSAGGLLSWLKDPQGIWPETRMPSLRLTDAEASAVTAWLLTLGEAAEPEEAAPPTPELLARGEALLRRYGCSGCHDIAGFERAGKIGPDHSELGVKPTTRFDFGDFLTDPRHQRWDTYVFHKLRSPRVYAHERFEAKMPRFPLREAEILDLMVLLRSLTPEAAAVPTDYRRRPSEDARALSRGRLIVEQRNCTGCHVLEGRAGGIRSYYTAEEQNTDVPPFLDGQGARVFSDWTFAFLDDVSVLRPWLEVRMPTFTLPEDEARAVARLFSLLDRQPWPFEHHPPPDDDPRRFARAHELFGKLQCDRCHPDSDEEAVEAMKAPDGALAPRLDLSPRRIQPDWSASWLRDPQRLQAGTRMPAFFYTLGSADPDDWWEDAEDDQARALLPEGMPSLTVYEGRLECGADPCRIDWAAAFPFPQAIFRIEPDVWQPLEVAGFAWPAAAGGESPPWFAEVRLTAPAGEAVSGVVRLRGQDGRQGVLQGVQAMMAEPEAGIRAIVDYLTLVDRREELLAAARAAGRGAATGVETP